MTDPSLAKADLRRAARARRDALPRGGADQLAAHLACWLGARRFEVIGGYWPIGSEIDPRPALRAITHGAQLALPEATAPGNPLIFRRWTGTTALLPGPHGTRHPDGPPTVPDLLLVPLLAFDRRGHRLGYGGGYYDRTLAAHPGALAIGCAYAAQQVEDLPAGPHDVPLHAIATERGMIMPCR